MGKKQHQKDKLYLTTTEWRECFGGKKRKLQADSVSSGTYIRLPFHCCSISFQPFEQPCCSPDGAIFEKRNILDFLKKYGKHPISGGPLSKSDLIDLHFNKDAEGKYSCPVTYRVFNEHSNIVAIRTSGNVYSWDAIDHLNFKCESFIDLLSGVAFKGKADVIKLQDPINVERLDISKFYHVRYAMKTTDENPSDPNFYLNNLNSDAVSALKKFKSGSNQLVNPSVTSKLVKSSNLSDKEDPNPVQSCSISTGALAASLTSTAMDRVIRMTAQTRTVNSLIWDRMRGSKQSKAYLSLITNIGSLNLMLFASDRPKTVHNFLILCRNGYYEGCKFFRSIRHFIVQSGDPSNNGLGGESAWPDEPKFKDELTGSKDLKHDKRGVLSMANSGPNTNGSQFFITYRPCNQLNGKHTVFGQLVGGFETLAKIESIDVDERDQPKVDVIINRVEIFEDPSKVIEEKIMAEIKADTNQIERKSGLSKQAENGSPLLQFRQNKSDMKAKLNDVSSVGKYLKPMVSSLTKSIENSNKDEKISSKKSNNSRPEKSTPSEYNEKKRSRMESIRNKLLDATKVRNEKWLD